MTWATPESDLRTALSDNATDKLRYRKSLIGQLDGANNVFKTLEFRRLTNFTTAVAPEGVYINGAIVPGVSISADFNASGEFELVTSAVPSNGDRIEATYYIQWFNNAEIAQFLRLASNWCNLGDDYTQISQGLRPAVLEYAQGEAYTKLALRWSERLSETFLLEDAIAKDRFAMVESYRKTGADLKKSAQVLRKQFYTRSDENEAPLFGNNVGRVAKVVPNE